MVTLRGEKLGLKVRKCMARVIKSYRKKRGKTSETDIGVVVEKVMEEVTSFAYVDTAHSDIKTTVKTCLIDE